MESLAYRMAVSYLCECVARGECNGWLWHLGIPYKPVRAKQPVRGGCWVVESLVKLLGKRGVVEAAIAHYIATRLGDETLLEARLGARARSVIEALRLLNLL